MICVLYLVGTNDKQRRDEDGHAQIYSQNNLHHPRREEVEEDRPKLHSHGEYENQGGDRQQDAGDTGNDRTRAQRLAQTASFY